MATRKRTSVTSGSKPLPKDMKEDSISNEEEKMSLKDKLNYIDQEIRKLHVFCVNSGYSSAEIERFAKPFSKSITAVEKERWIRRSIGLAVFVAVVAVLFYVDPVYKIVCVVGKMGAMTVLPVWDWTRLYNNECVVNNPLYTGKQLLEEDCEICEGMSNIERVSDLNGDDIIEQYLKRDLPIIVEDGTKGWPSPDKYSIAGLSKAYHNNLDLKAAGSCLYSSNVRSQYTDHHTLLRKAAKGEIVSFFAHWENCFVEAAKAFRYFYKRPYFMPRIIEMGLNNWVFISSQYSGKLPKRIYIEYSMVVMAQVKGTMEVTVTPREPCKTICTSMTEVLHEGEILVVTDFMWYMEYVPHASEESITIGFGGTFD